MSVWRPVQQIVPAWSVNTVRRISWARGSAACVTPSFFPMTTMGAKPAPPLEHHDDKLSILSGSIQEAQRALALRKRLDQKWLQRGDLTEGEARYSLAAMVAIVWTLPQLDMDQRQLPRFREEKPFSIAPKVPLGDLT